MSGAPEATPDGASAGETGGTGGAPYRLERLAAGHRTARFDCGPGGDDQTAYLRDRALREQELGLAAVWVVTRPGDPEVLGYFTLSPTAVRLDEVLVGLLGDPPPYRQVPGYLLGQLGVAASMQGEGVGRALVVRAYDTARALARTAGGVFLLVDARTDRLVAWYERFGFRRLSRATRRLARRLEP